MINYIKKKKQTTRKKHKGPYPIEHSFDSVERLS